MRWPASKLWLWIPTYFCSIVKEIKGNIIEYCSLQLSTHSLLLPFIRSFGIPRADVSYIATWQKDDGFLFISCIIPFQGDCPAKTSVGSIFANLCSIQHMDWRQFCIISLNMFNETEICLNAIIMIFFLDTIFIFSWSLISYYFPDETPRLRWQSMAHFSTAIQ